MIHLTEKEKADRFDALQTTFRYVADQYGRRREESIKRYKGGDPISAYNKGLADAYEQMIEDLKRWTV